MIVRNNENVLSKIIFHSVQTKISRLVLAGFLPSKPETKLSKCWTFLSRCTMNFCRNGDWEAKNLKVRQVIVFVDIEVQLSSELPTLFLSSSSPSSVFNWLNGYLLNDLKFNELHGSGDALKNPKGALRIE